MTISTSEQARVCASNEVNISHCGPPTRGSENRGARSSVISSSITLVAAVTGQMRNVVQCSKARFAKQYRHY
jgi:hypothetical protein